MKKRKFATHEFTEMDLPSTRRAVFYDCYRVQFSTIFKLGLRVLLMLIPMLLVMMLRDSYILSAYQQVVDPTAEQLAAIGAAANTVFGTFDALALVLFGTLFSGVTQVIRQLIWGEPLFFGDDFKRGLKSNAATYFFVSLFFAAAQYVLNQFYGSELWKGVLYFIFLPVGIWILLQSLYYKLTFREIISNGLIFFIKTAPMSLVLTFATVFPFFVVSNFVNLLLARYLLFAVLALFYIVPLSMVWMLYACSVFDKYVNKERYPSIYKKGLYIPENQEN